VKSFDEIAATLLEQAGPLAEAVIEAERLAEEERQRQEAEHQAWLAREAEKKRREEEERERVRRLKAATDSRAELLAVVEDWALADRLRGFFREIEARVASLPDAERQAVLERVQAARATIGDVDALARLRQWRTPAELLVGDGTPER
jgi:GTP1/Obg family GTP-binding protein